MSKNEKIKEIKKAVETALTKYDVGNVDIVKEDNLIHIMYHSRHNSFGIVNNVCDVDELSETDIDIIANCYSIGYCW